MVAKACDKGNGNRLEELLVRSQGNDLYREFLEAERFSKLTKYLVSKKLLFEGSVDDIGKNPVDIEKYPDAKYQNGGQTPNQMPPQLFQQGTHLDFQTFLSFMLHASCFMLHASCCGMCM